jgi:hypothetical protein
VIKDPDLTYTGEAEAWRDNIELLFRIGGGLDGMLRAIRRAQEAAGARQADWATWIAPMTLDELREYVGTRRDRDVSVYRPYMAGRTDEQIREAMGFDPRVQLDRLHDDKCYALVAVEGI